MVCKRIGLLVAAIAFLAPPAALADGIDFSLNGGALSGNPNGSMTNLPNGSTLNAVTKSPNPPGPSFALGGPTGLGTVSFTTGASSTWNSSTWTLLPGGSISIASNGSFAPDPNATLFSGFFSGPTSAICLSGNWNTVCSAFDLTGTVAGNVNPALLAYLGLPPLNNGFIVVLNVGFAPNGGWQIQSGDIVLAAPEPGTLALFGIGLAGLAVLVLRKVAANFAALGRSSKS